MNFNTEHKAEIVEIFSSIQGEGLYVGEPTTFARFQKCNLKCSYCDTPQGLCHHDTCRVESPPGSENFEEVHNPVTITKLCELLEPFEENILAVTGGEPLEQAKFLSEWLPTQHHKRRILLETNGILYEHLDMVLPYIHVVSMDLKLPTSTGQRPCWQAHSEFLKTVIAAGREIYVKIVVTGKTSDKDIENAIGIITKTNRYIPTIIQPASTTLTFNNPISKDRLESVHRLCSAYLSDVKIIPQMHKEWGIL